MTPGRRRLLTNLLRVAFSLTLLAVAYHFIRLQDTYRVEYRGRVVTASEVREEEGQILARHDGSTERFPAGETRVERRPGFLSLFRKIDRPLFFVLLPGFLFPFVLVALRWWILLRANGFPIDFRRAFSITYIGLFLNNFLPGGVGGDIGRAWIGAKGRDRKAAWVGTILLDRLIGLGAMVLLASACVVPFVTEPAMRLSVVLIGALVGGMIAAYLLYFSPLLRKNRWVDRIRKSERIGEIVRDLDGALKTLKSRRGVVVACALLSLLAQSGMILLTYGLARALGISGVSLASFFIFEPLIFIVTAVPISAGRLGVQEGAYVFFFSRVGLGPNEAVAISVLFTLTSILVSIPGGILMALGGARKRDEGRFDLEIRRSTRDVPAEYRPGDHRTEH